MFIIIIFFKSILWTFFAVSAAVVGAKIWFRWNYFLFLPLFWNLLNQSTEYSASQKKSFINIRHATRMVCDTKILFLNFDGWLKGSVGGMPFRGRRQFYVTIYPIRFQDLIAVSLGNGYYFFRIFNLIFQLFLVPPALFSISNRKGVGIVRPEPLVLVGFFRSIKFFTYKFDLYFFILNLSNNYIRRSSSLRAVYKVASWIFHRKLFGWGTHFRRRKNPTMGRWWAIWEAEMFFQVFSFNLRHF
jgi:hypothetical protein